MDPKVLKKKTILFIHHGACLGGAASSLLDVLKEIDRSRWNPVVALPEEGPFTDQLREAAIETFRVPLLTFSYGAQFSYGRHSRMLIWLWWFPSRIRSAFGNFWYLPPLIRRLDPALVVINSSTLLLSGILARLMRRRVLWHVREVIGSKKPKILDALAGAVIRFSAEKVVVYSEYSRRDMTRLKVSVVRAVFDPVNLERFALKKEFSARHVVGFAGHIYYQKGWRTLVQAAFAVSRRMPEVRFLVAGSSHMIARPGGAAEKGSVFLKEEVLMRRIVRDLGLEDRFAFLGQRIDMENVYPQMDCLVFPSITPEPFGRVIAEAMACGVPVIASDHGASSELIEEGVTGFLVEPGNPRALADALIRCLSHPQNAAVMGRAARRRAEALFNRERTIRPLRDLYCGSDLILNRKPGV